MIKAMKKTQNNYVFEAIFTPQEEGGFTVEVPDLPGCVSEGETFEEAEENIQEAIGLYLETLEERGLPIPVRGMKVLRMNITISKANSRRHVNA
jgi:predicted RNase H-like HicB family nuclease